MKLYGSLSRLVSILFYKNSQDITVRPNQTTTYTAARDIQMPNGDTDHILVSRTSTDTLTNKTIDGDDNTLQDISISSLKTVLGDADEVILRDGAGAVVSAKLVNANVDAAAAIAESKLALDYSTSSLNTAIGTKVSKSGDTMSGNLAMGGNKVTGLGAATTNGDAVRYEQLTAVEALINGLEWQESAFDYITDNTADPTGNEVSGRRLVLSATGGAPHANYDGASAGDIVEFNGSVWVATTPTTGMFISVDDESSLLYYWGGAAWSTKSFEATTASTGLTKVGVDVRLADAAENASGIKVLNGAITLEDLGAFDTADLAEGTNLYFTDERAQDAIGNNLLDTSSVDLAYNDGTGQISATVLPAGVDHDSLQNFVANEHVDHSSVQIATSSTSGLNGGGDLTATRNIVAAPERATAGTVAAADEILFADVSAANVLRKTTAQDIANLAAGSPVQAVTWTDGSATFNAAHTFNSQSVLVEVVNELYETVWVDRIDRTSTTNVQLERSEATVGFNWTVLIRG